MAANPIADDPAYANLRAHLRAEFATKRGLQSQAARDLGRHRQEVYETLSGGRTSAPLLEALSHWHEAYLVAKAAAVLTLAPMTEAT